MAAIFEMFQWLTVITLNSEALAISFAMNTISIKTVRYFVTTEINPVLTGEWISSRSSVIKCLLLAIVM